MKWQNIPYLTRIIWGILAVATVVALATGRWSTAFVSVTAILMTVLPAIFSERLRIALPLGFLAAISVFVFATLFLGEVFDFYERFWWWDILLHGFSAVGFGIIGFLFVFYLFEGDRYAAPPWALGLIAFTFALSIGALWEIFEFAMDQIFGLNMQKSGLIDTMWDLIVDTGGAAMGASAGFFWLKGRNSTLTALIEEFVDRNRTLYRKLRRRRRGR
jgi:hypothetical protein